MPFVVGESAILGNFVHMKLEYFQEGIVGERMDSYPWVKLACTD
jgi:hypothetical protein